MMVGTAHTYTHANNQGPPQRSPVPVSSNVLSNIRSRALKWMGLQPSLDYHTSSSLQDSPRPVERWEESTLLLHGSLLAQSCRATAILAGAESGVQECAASLASNLSLATQVSPPCPTPSHPSGSHPALPALPPGGDTNLAVLPFSMPYLHAGITAGSG